MPHRGRASPFMAFFEAPNPAISRNSFMLSASPVYI
jgi:hypothetical protein